MALKIHVRHSRLHSGVSILSFLLGFLFCRPKINVKRCATCDFYRRLFQKRPSMEKLDGKSQKE